MICPVMYCFAYPFLVESPRYLVSKGREAEALSAIKSITIEGMACHTLLCVPRLGGGWWAVCMPRYSQRPRIERVGIVRNETLHRRGCIYSPSFMARTVPSLPSAGADVLTCWRAGVLTGWRADGLVC